MASVFTCHMKLKSFFLAAGAGVLLLGAVAIPVLRAQQRAADDLLSGTTPTLRRPMVGLIMRRVAARLHVTDDQKLAALGVLRNHQAALKPLVDQLIKERFALRKTLEASSVDEAAVRAGSARVAAVEAEVAVQKAYLFHDLRAVATPDQSKEIDQMEANAETRVLKVVDLVSDWIAQS